MCVNHEPTFLANGQAAVKRHDDGGSYPPETCAVVVSPNRNAGLPGLWRSNRTGASERLFWTAGPLLGSNRSCGAQSVVLSEVTMSA
jgi:hypothetical protein